MSEFYTETGGGEFKLGCYIGLLIAPRITGERADEFDFASYVLGVKEGWRMNSMQVDAARWWSQRLKMQIAAGDILCDEIIDVRVVDPFTAAVTDLTWDEFLETTPVPAPTEWSNIIPTRPGPYVEFAVQDVAVAPSESSIR